MEDHVKYLDSMVGSCKIFYLNIIMDHGRVRKRGTCKSAYSSVWLLENEILWHRLFKQECRKKSKNKASKEISAEQESYTVQCTV